MPARIFGIALELRLQPAARGADPAGLTRCVRKRVTGAEADQLADARLDFLGGDFAHDAGNLRVRFRAGRGAGEARAEQDEKEVAAHGKDSIPVSPESKAVAALRQGKDTPNKSERRNKK